MKSSSPLSFVFKATIFGLAVAFIVLLLRPDLLGRGNPVVEISEVGDTERFNLTTMAPTGQVSYSSAVDIAAPAVANIYSTKVITERANPLFNDPFFRYFFGDRLAPRQRLESSLGSGVIVSKNGYVLTNYHVIEGADEIQVALRDGRSAEAEIAGTDPESDLAVLKIQLEKLPTITFASSDDLKVGDVVLAIGNPFGVGQTVTMGIVSATGRDRLGINVFENFIQTDAAINPGNSGGALVNPYGHLVGINTAIFSRSGGYQGIGFAIPVSSAIDVMQQIIETGHVTRGWLGIEVQDITPQLAESFGLKDTQGVIVAGILRNGPAANAGLQPGDVIKEINGKPMRDSRDVMNVIAKAAPEEKVFITILRQGKKDEIQASVGKRPPLRSQAERRG
ncbi:MAG: Do family serine endopeptidase [Gammaproteobacteria bacterium]|jgi:serine protease DegS|nr:Do family serine endopeptidase [Gammaproteobacteria bacterium]